MGVNFFQTDFLNVGEQEHLKCGALYRFFWDVHGGCLINESKSKFPLTELGKLMKPHKAAILKKGTLDREFILIDLPDIEPRTGKIINERYVTEIGSDKIVFEDADILISKLRPYLGYVILNNKSKLYIGTTELVPFKVDEKRALPQYIKRLLLSSRFLEKSTLFMYGKEHPRISISDLLNVKVPDVPLTNQEEIAKKVEKIEKKIDEISQELVPLQNAIEETFIKFELKSLAKKEKKEFELFQTSFAEIGNQKFLRCGVGYRCFYDIHNALLFDKLKCKYPVVKLGQIIKMRKTKILKKGVLDHEYILVELEDIEQYTGKIANENRIVTEIGSDKVLFGDADIMISKIDPYLGYVILNDKTKPYIGTTELLPFKVDDKMAMLQFVKYLLISREFLEKSISIMYGKRHPRIHPLDLLNIKVPCPLKSPVQEKVVEEISKIDEKNLQSREKMRGLREEMGKIFLTDLIKE